MNNASVSDTKIRQMYYKDRYQLYMTRKEELRKEILTLRDQLSLEECVEKSKRIVEKVIKHKKFQEADKVLLFASFRSEVDTTAIFKTALQMGKEVYFPKVEGKIMEFYRVGKESDLLEGYRGIREPLGDEELRFRIVQNMQTENMHQEISVLETQRTKKASHILVIMPGVAFDAEGNRIGYGGGYYDKFLQKLESKVKKANLYKLAIAFQCQMVEKIISASYDVKPNIIITEETEYTI